MTQHRFCPRCRSKKPLIKAGKARGWKGYERQRYLCTACRRLTVNPLEGK